MVHFLTAPVYKFPIGSGHIRHTNVNFINISNTDNLKRDPLEIQHPNFEKSKLGLIVSVHEREWQMRHPSCRLVPGLVQLCSQINIEKDHKM